MQFASHRGVLWRLFPALVGSLTAATLVLFAATPTYASSITLLVGDKDGFGLGLAPGAPLPWVSPIEDARSAGEIAATNGAELTDTYSALYSGSEDDCTGVGRTCTLNSDTGLVVFPFAGLMLGGTLAISMGDFQCEFGAMAVDINGVGVPFCFFDGYHTTAIRQFTLTPAMLSAANTAGEVRLFFDHRATWNATTGTGTGTFDYVAFDYFELDGQVVPEPGTWLLIGTGLAGVALARRRARRSRLRSS